MVVGDAVAGFVNGILGSPIFTRLADLIPDPLEKAKMQAELEGQLLDYASKSDLAQLAVNNTEAANANIFVSGWRPFIGWVCGVAFGYQFFLQPLLLFFMAAFGHNFPVPTFDMGSLSTVLMAMLGLGGMRTIEKMKGAS